MKKYASDKSFKDILEIYIIKDSSSAIMIRSINLIFKLISCVLYVVETTSDDTNIQHLKDRYNQAKLGYGLNEYCLFSSNSTASSSDIDWLDLYEFLKIIKSNKNLKLGISCFLFKENLQFDLFN
jgi:hypothetical protein